MNREELKSFISETIKEKALLQEQGSAESYLTSAVQWVAFAASHPIRSFDLASEAVDSLSPCGINVPFYGEIISFLVAQEVIFQIYNMFPNTKLANLKKELRTLEKEIKKKKKAPVRPGATKAIDDVAKRTGATIEDTKKEFYKLEKHLENIADGIEDAEFKSSLKTLAKEQKQAADEMDRLAKLLASGKEIIKDGIGLKQLKRVAGVLPGQGLLSRLVSTAITGKILFPVTAGAALFSAAGGIDTIIGDEELNISKGITGMADKFGFDKTEGGLIQGAVGIALAPLCFALQLFLVKAILRKYGAFGGRGTGLRGFMKGRRLGGSVKDMEKAIGDLIKQSRKELTPDLVARLNGDLGQKMAGILASIPKLSDSLLPVREEIVTRFLSFDTKKLATIFKSGDPAFWSKQDVLTAQFERELASLYKMVMDSHPLLVQGAKEINVQTLSNKNIFPMLSQLDPKSRKSIFDAMEQYNKTILEKLGIEASKFMRSYLKEGLEELQRLTFESSSRITKELSDSVTYYSKRNGAGRAEKARVYQKAAMASDAESMFNALRSLSTFKNKGVEKFGPFLFDPNFKIPKGVERSVFDAALRFKKEFQNKIDKVIADISKLNVPKEKKESLLKFARDIKGDAPKAKPRGAKIKDRDTIVDRPTDIDSLGGEIEIGDADIIGSRNIKELNTGNKIMTFNKNKLKNLVKQVLNEKNKSYYPYQEPEKETDERDLSLEYKQILDDMEADPGVEVAVALAKCLVKDQELFSVIMQMVKENPDVMERFVKLFRQQKQKAV